VSYTLVNPYCTLDQLKDELKRKRTDASIDDELGEAIVNASRWVDDYLKRDFFFHDYSVTGLVLNQFSSEVIGNQIFLNWPILSMASASLGSTGLISGTDYLIQGSAPHDNRILTRLPWIEGNTWYSQWTGLTETEPTVPITLMGTFGYSQGSPTADHATVPIGIPGKINLATRLVAAALSGHNRKQVAGLDSQPTEIMDRKIPQTVYDMLGKRIGGL
jgi:hypothetical protein